MAEARATTIRFSEPMYGRLEHAGEVTGLPINSIVVIACLEWLDAHQPLRPLSGISALGMPSLAQGATMMAPRRSGFHRRPFDPFDRFTERAKQVLMAANDDAEQTGQASIGDHHLLLGLARDQDSIAGRALKNLGVTVLRISDAMPDAPPPGGRILGHGLTSDTRRVIEDAFKIARAAGHAKVGTRVLLLALAENPKNQSSTVLSSLKITPEQLKTELDRLSGDAAGDAD